MAVKKREEKKGSLEKLGRCAQHCTVALLYPKPPGVSEGKFAFLWSNSDTRHFGAGSVGAKKILIYDRASFALGLYEREYHENACDT